MARPFSGVIEKSPMIDATIKDIAEKAGVSYATVSRTLNNKAGVNENTRKKVSKIATELGYSPNLHARSLKTNLTYTIALIVPDITNPFFSDIACAVTESAYTKGYATILCSTSWNSEIEKAQLKRVLEQRVDGIILKPAGAISDQFYNVNTPVVIISSLSNEKTSFIEVDNHKGGMLAAEHLYAKGYQRVAFVGGESSSRSNLDRLTGFLDGLQLHGIAVDDSRIKFGPFTTESGYRLAKELMTAENPPDAIFCGNDLIALGVYQFIGEQGISVPEECGIVGFDDIYLASLPQIQMTTIAQPREKIGQLASKIIINAIEKFPEKDIEHVLLEPKIVVRKSTRS